MQYFIKNAYPTPAPVASKPITQSSCGCGDKTEPALTGAQVTAMSPPALPVVGSITGVRQADRVPAQEPFVLARFVVGR